MLRYLLLALVLFSCSHKPEGNPDSALFDQLVIVGTNDFHGYLLPTETNVQGAKVISGGAEWFAGYVRILERKYGDRLIMLDGGDLFQGTLESNSFLGAPVVDFYNLLPYRAAAVGNHEFDYGPRKRGEKDRLGAFKDRMAQAKFPFVQANIYRDGKPWKEKNLFPSVLVNAGDYKVGIIGLTTVTTPAKTLPQNVVGLEFRDFVQPTLEQAQALRARGADFVMITTHEGGEREGEPIYELLRALPAGTIDALVGGHAHAEVHEFVQGVPVIQSRTRGQFFGRIDLFVNKATRKIDPSRTRIHEMQAVCGTWFQGKESCDAKLAKPELLPLRPAMYEGEAVEADTRVKEVLAPYFAKTAQKKKEVLGRAKRDFAYFPSGENEMGVLFLKAFRWKFPQAKVAYTNGGGIRRKFTEGPVTYGDLYEVHPFDNYSVAVKMNGRLLKRIIEVGVSGSQSIPAVSGLRVKYADQENPEFNRDLNGDGKEDKWERNRLLSLQWDDGRSVGDEEVFWVATNDYLVSGGDNLEHVFSAIPARDKKYSDTTQRDMVAEYLRAHKRIALPPAGEPKIEAVR